MRVTIALARVYGVGRENAGGAEKRRGGTTMRIADFPRRRWRTSISLGEPVGWLFDAERLARVMARTMLDGSFGRANESHETTEVIDRLVADETLGPSADEREWWVTIVSEHDIELPDDEWTAKPFMWLSFARAESVTKTAVQDSRGALDVLSILVRNIVQASNTVPIFDRAYFLAEGKPPFRPPEFTLGTGGTITISADLARLDLNPLARDLKRASALLEIRNTAYWWARAREVQDSRERFQFAFIGLETLAHKLAPRAHARVLPELRAGPAATSVPVPLALIENPDTLPLAAKFGLVALLLAPTSAVEDTAMFKDLKKARDGLAHGDLDVSAPLPDGKAVGLLNKYVELATAYLYSKAPKS